MIVNGMRSECSFCDVCSDDRRSVKFRAVMSRLNDRNRVTTFFEKLAQ